MGDPVGAETGARHRRRRVVRPGEAVRLGRLASAPCTSVGREASAAAEPATLTHQGARRGFSLSTYPVHQRRADTVAGFLCAFSFALSGLAIAVKPGLLAPVAILLALVAARMTESHRTLAGIAVILATLGFFFGMIVAISTDNPLF